MEFLGHQGCANTSRTSPRQRLPRRIGEQSSIDKVMQSKDMRPFAVTSPTPIV